MPNAPSSDNILLGKGELLFDRFDANGVRTGYMPLGNCNSFGITLNDDVLKMFSSQNAAAGLYKQVTKSREVVIDITANEFSIENMALGLMGDQTTLSQTSSAVTGEVLTTSVELGRVYKAAGRNLTGVVITQGTVTLSATTHYTVFDASAGLIRFASASAAGITTATTATIAYTRAALTSLNVVLGATKTKIEGGLLFVPDPTTGPQYDIEVYRCAVTPGGTLGFISDNFGEFGLKLGALDDSAGVYGGSTSSPYFRMIQRGTA